MNKLRTAFSLTQFLVDSIPSEGFKKDYLVSENIKIDRQELQQATDHYKDVEDRVHPTLL